MIEQENIDTHCRNIWPEYILTDTKTSTGLVSSGSHRNGYAVSSELLEGKLDSTRLEHGLRHRLKYSLAQ